MSEDTGEQFIPADKDLNPLDLFLVNHTKDIGNEDKSAMLSDEINRLANGFLRRVGQERKENRFDLDHSALTAYLFDSFYSKKLTDEQKAGVGGILDEAGKKSPLFRSLKLSLDTLDSEVRHYYQSSLSPFGYWIPSSFDNRLADIILKLKCNALKQELQGKFNKQGDGNMVIEYFTDKDTGTGEFGIWMSTSGIQFDKEKVNNGI